MTVSGLSINNYQLQYQLLKPETEAFDSSAQRQEIANIATTAATPATQQAPQQQDETSKQQEAFLNQLMDQMLANRIGLDKQKYDEIQQKIEEAQAEKDALQQQPQSPERDGKIAALDAKLDKLGKALEGLVAEANRNREAKEREKQAVNAVQQYQITAHADNVGTNTDKKPTLFL
jgi:predicted nuclease with TOPRIM domain